MVMTYVPVAGLTIKEALSRAIKLSKDNKQPVMAIINDVVMNVDDKTCVTKALIDYHQKLKLKYYVEHVKRAQSSNEF